MCFINGYNKSEKGCFYFEWEDVINEGVMLVFY